MNRINRRVWMKVGAASLGVAALPAGAFADDGGSEFAFHHDHVLGTSLDLWFRSPDEAAAEEAERVALDEVERLRKVFSLYNPQSELSRLNRSSGPVPASADLIAVLREYECLQPLCSGTCNPQVGSLVQLWTEAARDGQDDLDDDAAAVLDPLAQRATDARG